VHVPISPLVGAKASNQSHALATSPPVVLAVVHNSLVVAPAQLELVPPTLTAHNVGMIQSATTVEMVMSDRSINMFFLDW